MRERNASLPPFNFYIDPDTFVGFVGVLERPSADEADEVVVVADSDRPMQTGFPGCHAARVVIQQAAESRTPMNCIVIDKFGEGASEMGLAQWHYPINPLLCVVAVLAVGRKG